MLDEAFRVSDICGIKDGLRLSEDDGRLAMMQGRCREEGVRRLMPEWWCTWLYQWEKSTAVVPDDDRTKRVECQDSRTDFCIRRFEMTRTA